MVSDQGCRETATELESAFVSVVAFVVSDISVEVKGGRRLVSERVEL